MADSARRSPRSCTSASRPTRSACSVSSSSRSSPGAGPRGAAPGPRSVASTWRTSPSASLLVDLMVTSAVRASAGRRSSRASATPAWMLISDRLWARMSCNSRAILSLSLGPALLQLLPVGPVGGDPLPPEPHQLGPRHHQQQPGQQPEFRQPGGAWTAGRRAASRRAARRWPARAPGRPRPARPRPPVGARRRSRRSRRSASSRRPARTGTRRPGTRR